MAVFHDRQHAGKLLVAALEFTRKFKNPIVLALPRGGVPVAYEIATAYAIPLDVYIVRKLGVPGYDELAMGAIAMDGTIFMNDEVLPKLNISPLLIESVIKKEKIEMARRLKKYRRNMPNLNLHNKNIILVDDGVATGATMLAVIKAIRKANPESITVAVPVASISAYDQLKNEADNLICLLEPENFYAVGQWYNHFTQTSDDEVVSLLKNHERK